MFRRGRFLEGFTFVGLVIVLALLAAVSGGWIFLRPGDDGAQDGTTVADSAEGMALVQRIASEMRAMKQAAAMYKSDHGRWPEWAFDEAAGTYRNMSPGGEGILPTPMSTGSPPARTFSLKSPLALMHRAKMVLMSSFMTEGFLKR